MGPSSVGKSTLMSKFIDNNSYVHTPTIGVEYFSYIHNYNGNFTSLHNHDIKFSIWDLAGAERFRSITRSYIQSTMGLILVFDLSNSKSLANLEIWLLEIKEYLYHMGKKTDIPAIVIGNKKDSNNREVSTETGNEFASKYGYSYYETSALNDEFDDLNPIDEFFDKMVDTYQDEIHRDQKKYSDTSFKSKDKNKCTIS